MTTSNQMESWKLYQSQSLSFVAISELRKLSLATIWTVAGGKVFCVTKLSGLSSAPTNYRVHLHEFKHQKGKQI